MCYSILNHKKEKIIDKNRKVSQIVTPNWLLFRPLLNYIHKINNIHTETTIKSAFLMAK